MSEEPIIVSGCDLRVGDKISVWWSKEGQPPNLDTITALQPYRGHLACLKGAQLASFALNRTGMTIPATGRYEVHSRMQLSKRR